MAEDIESIIRSDTAEPNVKEAAWTAYHTAKDSSEFEQRLRALPLTAATKEALWGSWHTSRPSVIQTTSVRGMPPRDFKPIDPSAIGEMISEGGPEVLGGTIGMSLAPEFGPISFGIGAGLGALTKWGTRALLRPALEKMGYAPSIPPPPVYEQARDVAGATGRGAVAGAMGTGLQMTQAAMAPKIATATGSAPMAAPEIAPTQVRMAAFKGGQVVMPERTLAEREVFQTGQQLGPAPATAEMKAATATDAEKRLTELVKLREGAKEGTRVAAGKPYTKYDALLEKDVLPQGTEYDIGMNAVTGEPIMSATNRPMNTALNVRKINGLAGRLEEIRNTEAGKALPAGNPVRAFLERYTSPHSEAYIPLDDFKKDLGKLATDLRKYQNTTKSLPQKVEMDAMEEGWNVFWERLDEASTKAGVDPAKMRAMVEKADKLWARYKQLFRKPTGALGEAYKTARLTESATGKRLTPAKVGKAGLFTRPEDFPAQADVQAALRTKTAALAPGEEGFVNRFMSGQGAERNVLDYVSTRGPESRPELLAKVFEQIQKREDWGQILKMQKNGSLRALTAHQPELGDKLVQIAEAMTKKTTDPKVIKSLASDAAGYLVPQLVESMIPFGRESRAALRTLQMAQAGARTGFWRTIARTLLPSTPAGVSRGAQIPGIAAAPTPFPRREQSTQQAQEEQR